MPLDHYDVIVIGSGPGGASLAHRLAPTGMRILMLERGGYLPRSRANWKVYGAALLPLRERDFQPLQHKDGLSPGSPLGYERSNFTPLTGAMVTRLETDPAGTSIGRVHVIRDGQFEQCSADIVVVAGGALSSPLLMLRSASDAHPKALPTAPTRSGATTCDTTCRSSWPC